MNTTSPPRAGLENDGDTSLTGDRRLETDPLRTKELRRAQQNTRLVRWLRIGLPVSSAVVILLYGISAIGSFHISDLAKLPLVLPNVVPANLTMDNPRYRGFNDDGSQYVVTAKTAKPNPKNTNVVLLDTVTGELTDVKNAKTHLMAKKGSFDTKKNLLRLFDGIEIKSDDGMHARLKSAIYSTKTGIIMSEEPVSVESTTGKLSANKMRYMQKTKEAEFFGGVQTLLTSQKPKTAAASPQEKNAGTMFSNSGAPVLVKSGSLKISDSKNLAVYQQDVTVTQDDTSMATRELEVHYSGGPEKGAKVEGAEQSKPQQKEATSRRVERIISKHPVLIKRGKIQQVTGNSAEFLAHQNLAVINGDVVVTSGQDRRATSQRVEFNTAQDTALLTGDVIVRQNKNEMRGSRLFVDRRQGKLSLTTPKEQGLGRIYARLEGRPGAKKTGKQKKQAKTGEAKNKLASFKTNPGAPIDIEADRLDVDNTPKTAVFRGNVKAKQDTFSVQTSELTVRYKGDVTLDDAAGPHSKAKVDNTGPAMEPTQITARGNVVVNSSGGQSATGDWGEFDLARNTIVVGGDVVLTKGKNVVSGTRLKIDMNSGATVIDASDKSKKDAGWVARSIEKIRSGKKKSVILRSNRPSAVFYPSQFKKKKKGAPSGDKKKNEAATKPAGTASQSDASSSWQVQTATEQ